MAKPPLETDVLIVGAGPVGLFAVFECGMLNITCTVVDALDTAGGQCTALYPEKPIYDIPGFPNILAGELIERLVEQAAPFAPTYLLGQQVVALADEDDGRWRVETSAGNEVRTRAIVIAAGVGAFEPKRPPLTGIERYEQQPDGLGVHYRVEQREAYRGRRVVVAGGGDSAVDWAISLAEIAESIAFVHRRAKFRAAPDGVRKLRRLAETGAVDLVVPFQLHALEGDDGALRGVVVCDLDGGERRLPADALLAFFGLSQNLGPIATWSLSLDHNHIVVDPSTCATSRPGIFAVGDIASYPGKLKLILSGFAEAATAAHAIFPLVHRGETLHFEYSTTRGVPGR
jgi:thioredoxin reductase (NADPH)